MIPLGPWLPDLPDFQNPGATEAKNVIPDVNGYRPLPDIEAIDNPIGNPTTGVNGAFYSEDSAGTGRVYAGTQTKLHRYEIGPSPAAWEDVSRTVGGDYSTTSGQWRFVKFGARVIGVNGDAVPQSFVEGTSANFDALAGSPPPAARYVSVVRDFVNMAPLGNVQHWSAINNPTDWTPSATTQSDTQTIPEGGRITGLTSGGVGLTFMESAIYRQSYIGSPLIFQFDKLATDLGLQTDSSLAQYENLTFFWSDAGFKMIVGQQQIVPIGAGKVDRFFEGDRKPTVENLISACTDPVRKLYCCHYITGDNLFGIMLYHWPTQRWSHATFAQIDQVVQSRTSTTLGVYKGLTLTAFNTGRHYSFTGANLAATVETTEAQIFPGRRAFVQGVYPIVDGGDRADITVQLGTRPAAMDAVIWGSAAALNSSGMSPQRSDSKYHRARVSIGTGETWTHFQGVDVEAVPSGQR